MTTKDANKTFDAIKFVRDARKKVTADTQNMTLDQLRQYLAEQLKSSRLRTLGR